jgi:4-amino-4-deoxy-L-arabinose transferase-like glycosyltransferase
VAVYLVLAFAYSVRVPLYEAPDEYAHVKYVESLAFDVRLPDPRVTHQIQHPPLYYAIDAAVVRLLGLPRPAEQPQIPGGVQSHAPLYEHPDEAFPWRGPVASVQAMRAVTILFGAGLIILTYLSAQLIFPERKWLPLAAAATAAFVPQFAFIGSMVNNDVPAGFFAALAVYASARFIKGQDRRWLLLSAVAVGLAALTKSVAAVSGIMPLIAAAIVYPAWITRLRWAAGICAIVVLIAGWYYARSLILWGDIFPTDEFAVVHTPRGLGDPIYRMAFYDQLFDSYWYRGGWMNIRFTALPYRVLSLIGALAAGGVIAAFSFRLLDRDQRPIVLGLVAMPVLLFLAIIEYSVTQDWGPQGRYFFPAQAAIGILIALGMSSLFTGRGRVSDGALFFLPAVLLAMNVWIFAIKLPAVYG